MSRLTYEEQIDRAMLEDDLLVAVMGLFRVRRWLATHVRRSDRALTQGDPGFPDIIAGSAGGRLIVAELKKETAKLSPDQERWREFFTTAARLWSGLEYYVWRPSDWRTGLIERIVG